MFVPHVQTLVAHFLPKVHEVKVEHGKRKPAIGGLSVRSLPRLRNLAERQGQSVPQ